MFMDDLCAGLRIRLHGSAHPTKLQADDDTQGAQARRTTMKIIDMTHVMNVHTPGWVGYAGNKMYYAQNLQTQMIVAQRIDTALHVGPHFEGAMHATDNRNA